MTAAALNNFDFGIYPPAYRLPSTAHVGRIRLAVSNLNRSIDFYTRIIGLLVLSSDDSMARLAPHDSSCVLLELNQIPGVHPIQPGSRLGLYHPAFLLPAREELGRFVRHLHNSSVPFGAGDHLYSEALYLTDPDGLTVEVYADRDRSTWQVDGRELVSATNPVRLGELAELSNEPWVGMPPATTVGHIHFYVGNLKQAATFYHEALGLDLITWRYPGALFLSAGGYHHHVAVNTWAAASPSATEADARLLSWELVLPTAHDVSQAAASLRRAGIEPQASLAGDPVFTDPWGISMALVSQK
jgi:catechol 2,3-dioxygenase